MRPTTKEITLKHHRETVNRLERALNWWCRMAVAEAVIIGVMIVLWRV